MVKFLPQVSADVRRNLSRHLPPALRGNSGGATLLFVSAERTLRLDADGDGTLLCEVQEFPLACDTPERLAALVEAALAAGGPPEQAVWVLYDGLALHTLMLPAAQVAGVEGDALLDALRYEVEAAGLVPAGMDLAVAKVASADGMTTFALCLAPADLAESLRRAVRRCGARLAGLGHPAGLPESLSGAETWQRLEYWPALTVGVAGAPGARRWIHAFPAGTPGGASRKEIERWRRIPPPHAVAESLNSRDVLELDTESATGFLLIREGDRQRWLHAWLKVLQRTETQELALFRPVVKPVPEPVWMTLLAVVALLVCLGHYAWHTHQIHAAQTQTETLKKTEADMKTVQDGLKKDEEERGKLEQVSRMRRDNQAAIPQVVQALRQRFARLLYELAMQRGDAVAVESIVSSREGTDVAGVTVDTYEANRLATSVTAGLGRLGWRVEQPTREDLKMFGDGGPWRFAIRLRDEGLAGFAPAAGAKKP